MKPAFLLLIFVICFYAQVYVLPPTAVPSGPAGGGLGGTYPNPTVTVPGSTGYAPNQPTSGCGLEYSGTGFVYYVGVCNYTIAGVNYSTSITTLTLSASDPSNPRIDEIAVDTTGSAIIIPGTPAASPQQPSTEPATQLGLNFIYVAAGSTTPSFTTVGSIYEENTEWTSSVTSNVNAASTNSPYRGTKDVEFTNAVLTNAVTLVKPASGTEVLSNWTSLAFYIRSKAQWPSGNGNGANAARSLNIIALSGSTQIGNAVNLKDGQFGFVSSTTSVYQQVVIGSSLFGTGSSTITSFKFVVTGNGGTSTIGFYLDGISLQGTGTITTTTSSRRPCSIVIGADNGSVLVDADIGPQGQQCQIPSASTVIEIRVNADAGTPNVIVRKKHCATASAGVCTSWTSTDLLSSALSAKASNFDACSNSGGLAGLDSLSTCSNTLQNTSLAAGDWLELKSGTAGGVAKRFSITIVYAVNQ